MAHKTNPDLGQMVAGLEMSIRVSRDVHGGGASRFIWQASSAGVDNVYGEGTSVDEVARHGRFAKLRADVVREGDQRTDRSRHLIDLLARGRVKDVCEQTCVQQRLRAMHHCVSTPRFDSGAGGGGGRSMPLPFRGFD